MKLKPAVGHPAEGAVETTPAICKTLPALMLRRENAAMAERNSVVLEAVAIAAWRDAVPVLHMMVTFSRLTDKLRDDHDKWNTCIRLC